MELRLLHSAAAVTTKLFCTGRNMINSRHIATQCQHRQYILKSNIESILTMYIGEPHSVAAITPSCKNRAKPKSAVNNMTQKFSSISAFRNITFCPFLADRLATRWVCLAAAASKSICLGNEWSLIVPCCLQLMLVCTPLHIANRCCCRFPVSGDIQMSGPLTFNINNNNNNADDF